MHFSNYRAPAVLLTVVILLLLGTGAAYALPADVQDHWARPAIKSLMQQGILAGYPDQTFKPDRSVSRAEFARIAVKAFGLSAAEGKTFTDTAGHWARNDIAALVRNGIVNGYPDGSFRPDQPITRAGIVTALSRLLKLGGKEQTFGHDWAPAYPDVPRSHQAFRLIELARRLEYLPLSYGPSFLPNALVTRAEAAWMVYKATKLGRTSGSVIETNPGAGTITIAPANGAGLAVINVDPMALMLRNNSAVTLDQILVDDELSALTGSDGLAKVVQTSGKVNTNDLVSRLNGWTKGLLTPETVTAITGGNWTAAQEGLKNVLFDRLLQMGLGPGEAQSLLDRDWVTLDLLSRDQLISALSSRLGISTDLSTAILNRDLARVKDLLQTEITAVALERLLKMS